MKKYNYKKALISYIAPMLLSLLLFISIQSSYAQNITNYAYTSSSGTFTALAGATNPSMSSGTTDDGYFNSIPIGFDFFYMGTRYTTIAASTNGWISLEAVITDPAYTNNLTSGGAPRPIIAPLWDDLDIQAATNLSYLTSGTAPNRIFTLQYLSVKWQYPSTTAIDFQIRLYESSGKIDFVYRNQAGAVSGPSASVGITATATGSGTFLSLNKITNNSATVSSTVETNTVSVKPTTSGQTYTFTPPSPTAPTSLTFSSVTSISMTLNWTDNSSNETGFAIYRSTDNVTFTYYSMAAVNATSGIQTGLAGSTTYYWQVYAVTEGKLSTALSGNQATLCPGPSISQVPTSGLIARYKLDNNANDEQNINQGIFQNGPTTTTDRFGNANKAYTFNGSNQFMATTNSYNNPSNFSICVWFKTTTTVGGRLIGFGDARVGTSGNHDRMLWMDNNGNLNFCVNPGGTGYVISSAKSYNDGVWHQATTTCSSVNGIKLYVDGILISSNASALGGQSYSGFWKLGWESAGWNPSSTSLFLNASLDDFIIYNREITSTEVTSIYNNPDGVGSNSPVCTGGTLNLTCPTIAGTPTYSWSGPNSFSSSSQNPSVTNMSTSKVGTYTLTASAVGCATTTVAYTLATIDVTLGPAISQIPASGLLSRYKLDGDATDANKINNGTLQNTPTATTDRFGVANKAYAFNGSSQFISTSVSYTNPSDLSLSLWFNTTTSTGGRLVGLGDSQTGGLSATYDRHIYMNDAGQLYFGVNPGTGLATINTTLSYNDGVWHHVAATLSSTTGITLYVDGTLISSNATPLGGQSYTGYWKIAYDRLTGWPSAPSSNYFNGSIDDVLIYSTALSAANITTLYNSPDGASQNGPVCVGSSLTLSATTVASTTYSWTGPNSFSSTSQNPTLTYVSADAGTYTLIATSGGCTSTAYTLVKSNTTTPGQWVGYTNTSWSNVDNWCTGTLPTATTDVTIPAVTNLPANSGTANVRNITINSSATLTNTATGVLNIYGNFTNNGTFTDNSIYSSTGVVNFVGASAQTITGATTFSNVTINNTSGVTLNSASTINGILTLSAGTFATGTNLNQNLYTGAIAPSGTGLVSGTIRFFKSIYGDRYHYMSLPTTTTGLTDAEWNDNVTLKFGANSNLYSYDETQIDTNKRVGWTALTTASTPLSPMTGYALFFPRFIYLTTLDVSSAYNHATITTSKALTNTASSVPVAKPASDGWNLIGNPYPTTLDWTLVTRTGFDNTIYMYDSRRRVYVAYTAGTGVSVNGGTQFIGSMQGFFVRVSSPGTSSLTLANGARVTSTLRDVWRTEEQVPKKISLTLTNGNYYSDEYLVYFNENATEQFDSEFDAYKMMNDATVPSLYSYSTDGEYAINCLPSDIGNKTIPLQLSIGSDSLSTWTANITGFEEDDSVVLEDRLLGTSQELTTNPTYTIQLSKGTYKNRFYLKYTGQQKTVTGTTGAASTNSGIEIGTSQQNVVVLFTDQNPGNANIAIYDAVGNKVYEAQNANTTSGKINVDLSGISNGLYIVKVQTPAATKSQQVFVQK
jgi:hypothetical protein